MIKEEGEGDVDDPAIFNTDEKTENDESDSAATDLDAQSDNGIETFGDTSLASEIFSNDSQPGELEEEPRRRSKRVRREIYFNEDVENRESEEEIYNSPADKTFTTHDSVTDPQPGTCSNEHTQMTRRSKRFKKM